MAEQTTPLQNLILGVLAGSTEVCIMQPTIYMKNASQQGLPLTMSPSLLYRGLGASVINMAVLTGLQFPLTGLVTTLVTGTQLPPSPACLTTHLP